MGSLLSAISGQFAKVVTLGTLFPVLIISILNLAIVTPIVPNSTLLQTQLKRIALGESTWTAVALTIVVVVFTGFLYNLNIPIIRLYEGYPWKGSWIGEQFVRRKKEQLREATLLRPSLRYLRRYFLKLGRTDHRTSDLGSQYGLLAEILNTSLPSDEGLLLPTRLGNVIRSFEHYSTPAYGMDAIVLWPRLLSKIDSAFASTIDEAKSAFDFMLNCSFLSLLTALGIVAIGLSRTTPLAWEKDVAWIWRAALFALISMASYQFSIGCAKAWGDQVKAAFDLYRLDLLKSLGYQKQPTSYVEEVAIWSKISAQLLFADSKESPLPYKYLPTRVIASPAGIELTIMREFGPTEPNGQIPVTITIKNGDRAQREAFAMKLIETLPDGFKYVPQTARTTTGTSRLSGIAPLELVIDDPLEPNALVVVSYDMKPPPQS